MQKIIVLPLLCLLLAGCGGGEQKEEQPKVYEVDESEVGFNNGEVSLSGTLALPDGKGPFPAVVLISGTGANSRDEEVAGFKVFKVLSDQLVPKGIVVLRYDDRGVGGSSGNVMESTTADFAKDVLAAVDTLKNNPKVDPNRIGLLGHDEGGWVASLAAGQSKLINSIILMGASMVKGEDLLFNQQKKMLTIAGLDDEMIQKKTAKQKRIFSQIRKRDGREEIKKEIKEEVQQAVNQLPEATRNGISNIDQFVDNTVNQVVSQVDTPWFAYFIDYDPLVELKKIAIPTLIVFGEKDLQLDFDQNNQVVEKDLKNNKCIVVEVIPGANHLFQAADTGSPSEYANLDKDFAPGFVGKISNWILNDSKSCKQK